ncbi:MAG: TerB family tellurite resistance protein [Pseudorhodobacter sp.]
MFDALLRRLAGPAPSPLPETEARLALAALLVRLARADGDYAPLEIARIDAVLAHRYALSSEAAGNLRAEAETLEAKAPDTVRFTRALKEAVPLEARAGLLEAMWSVVLTDDHRDDNEDQIMRLVSSLLGLSDRDSAEARQRATRA